MLRSVVRTALILSTDLATVHVYAISQNCNPQPTRQKRRDRFEPDAQNKIRATNSVPLGSLTIKGIIRTQAQHMNKGTMVTLSEHNCTRIELGFRTERDVVSRDVRQMFLLAIAHSLWNVGPHEQPHLRDGTRLCVSIRLEQKLPPTRYV